MKKHTVIIRVVLLAFVAVAIGYMFVRDRTSSPSSQAATKTGTAAAADGTSFVAYYFHNTRRCRTCQTIQAHAQEAISTRFAEQLRQGRLRWAAVNLEEIGNEHYASDYAVSGSSLVIAEVKGGRPIRFAKLEKVWQLVYQKPAFMDYVGAEVTAFLQAKR